MEVAKRGIRTELVKDLSKNLCVQKGTDAKFGISDNLAICSDVTYPFRTWCKSFLRNNAYAIPHNRARDATLRISSQDFAITGML